MAIIGLFSFGTISGYDITDLSGKKLTKSVYQSNNDLSSSKPVSKPKHKPKKRNKLSVSSKCSCCLYEDYEVYHAQWVNYCPQCHRRGTLVFEETYDCPEGMIRCTNCDADFCAVHGKEHVYSYSTYLTQV